MHEANRARWDLTAPSYREWRADWQRCLQDPSLGFERGSLALLRRYAGALDGASACVLGSGDNYAAFALCGLGARVTSVDISQAQLDVAAERAARLGLDIRFVRGDVTHLPSLPGGCFDLVCSTNGVMVWITDPAAYYVEACRLLRPGGILLTYDIHPFQRPWAPPDSSLRMMRSYFDSGPAQYAFDPARGETVSRADGDQVPDGLLPEYKCAWTVGELVQALLESGLVLRCLVEEPELDPSFWDRDAADEAARRELVDWHTNPRAGLPAWLTLVASKPE